MKSSESTPIASLATGFRKRTLVTAKLAGKLGVKYAKRAALGASNKAPTDDVAAAERLVDELGALKGLVMKFGQMASYMPGASSPDAQKVLGKLQAQSTAMEFNVVKRALEAELGAPVEELFDRFDSKAFASASIGQVHRASLDGKEVAVKVQYPGVSDVLASDLGTMSLLLKMSSIGSGMNGSELAEELAERMLEECDYTKEAQYQEFFGEILSRYPGARVPGVVNARSSTKVITSEFFTGQSFADFAATADQESKNRAATLIFRACFDCIFRHCVYNADPHPGNYLLGGDGSVCFLDFGCIRFFTADMIDAWKRVARTVLDGDQPGFRDAYTDLGFVANTKRFDWEHQWQMMQYVYRPFMQSGPFTYTDDYVKESYGLMIFDNPNKMITAMPKEWLVLNRLQWGLNAILAALHATGPWQEIWREAVMSPTAPILPRPAS